MHEAGRDTTGPLRTAAADMAGRGMGNQARVVYMKGTFEKVIKTYYSGSQKVSFITFSTFWYINLIVPGFFKNSLACMDMVEKTSLKVHFVR